MNLSGPIAIGNTAKIYLCDNKIIKVFKEHLPNTKSLYEAKKQEYAYSRGLHVPKVLEVTKIQNRQAIIMEYVEGKTVGDLLINNMELTEHYIGIYVDARLAEHVSSENIAPLKKVVDQYCNEFLKAY